MSATTLPNPDDLLWDLPSTVDRLARAAKGNERPSGPADASFEADGVRYARHGRTIVIDGRAYRLDGNSISRYFFRRLTEATI